MGRHHTEPGRGTARELGWASLWENPKLVYDLVGLSEDFFRKGGLARF